MVRLREELLPSSSLSWTVSKEEDKLSALVQPIDQIVLTVLSEDSEDLIEKSILVFQTRLEEWKF
jgi:hypothetical protein